MHLSGILMILAVGCFISTGFVGDNGLATKSKHPNFYRLIIIGLQILAVLLLVFSAYYYNLGR
jgi:hypothetical protein